MGDEHQAVPETPARHEPLGNHRRRLLPEPPHAEERRWPAPENPLTELYPPVRGLGSVSHDAKHDNEIPPRLHDLEGREDVRHEYAVVRDVMVTRQHHHGARRA